jgi:hypothetical protein
MPLLLGMPNLGLYITKTNLAYGTYGGGGGAKQFAIFHDLF